MPRPIVEELAVRLSSQSNLPLGKLLRFIKEHPMGSKEVLINTTALRFLPFALDKYGGVSPEELKDIALQCACQLEGYAQALREKFQLYNSDVAAGVVPINLSNGRDAATKIPTKELENNGEVKQLDTTFKKRRSIFG